MKKIMIGVFILINAFTFSAEAGEINPARSLNFAKEKQKYSPNGGCFLDEAAVASFWRVLKEGKKVPAVDFDKNLVVFIGGDGSFQQMFITKISIKEGIAVVAADGRSSGSTHEDGLALALAVIPRAGIRLIRIGQEQFAVERLAVE